MPTCIIGKVRIDFAKENLSHRRQSKIPASLKFFAKGFWAPSFPSMFFLGACYCVDTVSATHCRIEFVTDFAPEYS